MRKICSFRNKFRKTGGKRVILPEKLEEADTDFSSILPFNGHAETVQKILDVVKKSINGIDLAILGLENQQHIHYGMPLRIMLGDAMGYLKEYQEITKRNRAEGSLEGSEEYLSGFHREDRLHPMITICLYYGENEWDGPFSLMDMLKIPNGFRNAVNDYSMNLVQVRESEKFSFQNRDVRTVFEISRNIFKKDYAKIRNIYREQEIDAQLGIVIGSITDSRDLINHALKKKGGRMNMCTALEELKREGVREGIREGIREGMLQGKIIGRYEDGMSPEEIARKMGLTVQQIEEVLVKNKCSIYKR